MWVIFSIYRLPNVENLTDFFEEMTISLTKVTPNYKMIIVMGDVDFLTPLLTKYIILVYRHYPNLVCTKK